MRRLHWLTDFLDDAHTPSAPAPVNVPYLPVVSCAITLALGSGDELRHFHYGRGLIVTLPVPLRSSDCQHW